MGARPARPSLADSSLHLARVHVGRSREEFEEIRRRRQRAHASGETLVLACASFIEDRCEFDAEALVDPCRATGAKCFCAPARHEPKAP